MFDLTTFSTSFANVFTNSLLLQTTLSVGLNNWRLLYGFVYMSFFIAIMVSVQVAKPVIHYMDDFKEEDEVVEDAVHEVVDETEVEEEEAEAEETKSVTYDEEDYSDMPGLIKENEKEE